MKLAAIDIGSNAIRLQVIRVIRQAEGISFKKLEFIRFPLRLGKDVFETKKIGPETILRFEKLMQTFKLLIDLYEVEGYIAGATSAMREAKNGKEIIQGVHDAYDLNIQIISGREEAEILSKAIIPNLNNDPYLHIDVGGGSTELNLYVARERINSQSFQIGSVRQVGSRGRKVLFNKMRKWYESACPTCQTPVVAIGTGGNIRKLFKLSNYNQSGSISFTELMALKAYLSTFSFEQRTTFLKMNPDRADVIIPASEIYIEVMKIVGADRILVPNVGLKDGLLYQLYEQCAGESIKSIEFVDSFS